MDYIFWSALIDEHVDNVMVTYDIGCQWKVNLTKRLDAMPDSLQRAGSRLAIDVRLPVWHGNVHELSCRTANSVVREGRWQARWRRTRANLGPDE